MFGSSFKLVLLPVGTLALSFSLMSAPALRLQDPQPPAADNTTKNKDENPPTADQQKMNPTDRAIAQKIRKAIHEDKSLSIYAHNIKVISQDGKVTLRGPVRSEEDKANIMAKAAGIAGQENVTNELEIAPSN